MRRSAVPRSTGSPSRSSSTHRRAAADSECAVARARGSAPARRSSWPAAQSRAAWAHASRRALSIGQAGEPAPASGSRRRAPPRPAPQSRRRLPRSRTGHRPRAAGGPPAPARGPWPRRGAAMPAILRPRDGGPRRCPSSGRPAPRRAVERHGPPTTTSTAVPAPPRPGPPDEGGHPGPGTVRDPLPRQPLLRRTPAWGRPPPRRARCRVR